jgi:hypothetical protein
LATILPGTGVRAVGGDAATLLMADDTGTVRRSVDNGMTWSVVSGLAMPTVTDLVVSGSHVLALGAQGGPTPTFVVNASADGGLTWRAPFLLPTYAGFDAKASIADGLMFVHFMNHYYLTPNYPGLVITSRDDGAHWRAVSGPASEAFWPGELRTLNVTSSGNQRLAYVAMGHAVLGTSTPGTGSIAPALHGRDLPALGAVTSLVLEHALGGSLAVFGMSLSPPASTSVGPWTSWLQGTIALQAAPTAGAGAGTGTAALSVPIPAIASVVGMRLVSQACVLDGAAAGGIAVTNALETWIR